MTHHTLPHESTTPCVHSLPGIFTWLLWIPSLLAQCALWCDLTTSRQALDLGCSSNVSHLSLLNRNFIKHLKYRSGLLCKPAYRQMLNPPFSLLHLLSKRMHSPACLHTLSSASSTLKSCIVPQHIFGPSIYQSWISSSPAGSWNCCCTENAANGDQD